MILSYNADHNGGVYIGHEPVPKPRQTQSDKWKKRPCVTRYRAYADILKLVDNRLNGKLTKILDTGRVKIVFWLPIPKSRKEQPGDPHQVKPDADNLVKSVFDAICKNDSHIYDFRASKFYADRPGLYIIPITEEV